MKALAALLALAAVLTALVASELRPRLATPNLATPPPATPPSQRAAAAPAPNPTLDPDTLLARPLFSQTRRPPNMPGPAAAVVSAATPLPRMTGILIDGPHRSAIFATPDGRPMIVAEGGRIGSFTVQTIEPQRVTVNGPDGQRTVRTSFDPALKPPAAAAPFGIGALQFPGIAPGIAPGFPPGLPQPTGAAR